MEWCLHHFAQGGKARPCRVWNPHMKHLNQAMVVVWEPSVVHQVRTKVVQVGLASVTDQLQSIVNLKRHMHKKVKTATLKTKLIPESHGKFNSTVIEIIFLRILEGHTLSMRLTRSSERKPLRANHNHYHIFNCNFFQNTMWTCSKFVAIIVNCYLFIKSHYVFQPNAMQQTHYGKTHKDRIKRYMSFLGRTSDTLSLIHIWRCRRRG